MADEDQVFAQIPLEILQKLGPSAAQLGIELPGVARFAPTVDVTNPIRQLALELGKLVCKRDIFMKADGVVTVDPETGDVKAMTAKRFVGWVEEFCCFKSSARSQRVRDSLTREDASVILEQDIFRDCLRPLDAVHLMSLPVRRNGELWPVEFLKQGYDAESRIYTVATIAYEADWPLEKATAFLDKHGAQYPWAWPDEQRPALGENRSWSVQVLAMLGVYCRAMFPPGTQRPMIAYIANQAGTGKSTLAAMALMPVFGRAGATKTPKDDAEMDKELETVARTMQPFVFFDDIGGGIFSNPLNRFLTAESHSGRVMGGNNEFFQAPAVTQVFASGNDIKVSTDLMRRSLIVELFLSGEVKGREFDFTINSRYLKMPETRAQFLSALCAIVRHAAETREKCVAAGAELPKVRGIESFEDFTATLSAMVQNAGYNDPLASPDLAGGGAEDEDEMRELLIRVASDEDVDTTFDRKELVEIARTAGLLEGLVGLVGDKDLDSSAMKRWGKQLQKWRGRELVDTRGRRFKFSHKRQKRGAKYPLTFERKKEPASPAQPN